MLNGTFCKLEKKTFCELVSVAQDFEDSLEKENTLVDELVEGVSSGDESDDVDEGVIVTITFCLQSVSWSLAEFRHNKIVQSPHENYFNLCRQHKEK